MPVRIRPLKLGSRCRGILSCRKPPYRAKIVSRSGVSAQVDAPSFVRLNSSAAFVRSSKIYVRTYAPEYSGRRVRGGPKAESPLLVGVKTRGLLARRASSFSVRARRGKVCRSECAGLCLASMGPGPRSRMAAILTTTRVGCGQKACHLQAQFQRNPSKLFRGWLVPAKPQVNEIQKARAKSRANRAKVGCALGRVKTANGRGFDHFFVNRGQKARYLQMPPSRSPFLRPFSRSDSRGRFPKPKWVFYREGAVVLEAAVAFAPPSCRAKKNACFA